MKPPCCKHCRKPFQPEKHNAWHQKHCTRKACQRARNRQSCRNWRLKNPDHFKKDTQRIQDWRRIHPHYWRRERRKVLTADILLPVHGSGRVAMRFRDRIGITLRHVVIAKSLDWQAVCRSMGTTLQNVVHGFGFWTYRFGHEQEESHATAAAGNGEPPA